MEKLHPRASLVLNEILSILITHIFQTLNLELVKSYQMNDFKEVNKV